MLKLKPAITEDDHQQGNPNATITLVEFGDYECPHCGIAHPLIQRLLKERGEVVRFVFRNFPLQEIHPNAYGAALAAEAAGKQNSYWQMHDWIFDNQQQLSNSVFINAASTLRLDTKRFGGDWQSDETQGKVEGDFESGVRSGVNGTPTFFLNGSPLLTYDSSYHSLLKAVESELKRTGDKV